MSEDGDRWEAVINSKRALLPSCDLDARFNLLWEIAEIYDEKLQKYDEAIASALEAMKLKPETPWHKFMLLTSKVEPNWEKSIKLLAECAAIEKDSLRRGKFFYTAGVIYRDALKSPDEAIAQFNLALDSYFQNPERIAINEFQSYLKPLAAIDKLYETRKDLNAQAQNYHRMIERLSNPAHRELLAKLHGRS